jgi:hypothetical protein
LAVLGFATHDEAVKAAVGQAQEDGYFHESSDRPLSEFDLEVKRRALWDYLKGHEWYPNGGIRTRHLAPGGQVMGKTLPGRLSISGMRGGTMPDGTSARDLVAITLRDGSSGCELVEVLVDKRAFIDAVFGLADVPCAFEYRPDCPVGKRREVKTEEMPISKDWYLADRKALVAAALAPFEVDGWVGHRSDLGNHHRHARSDADRDWYRVTFVRYVDPEPPPTTPERSDHAAS